MDKKSSNTLIKNVPKAFTTYESADGETSDLGMLWEGVIQPAKIEAFEQNGKCTNLVLNAPKRLANNNVLIIKK